MERYAEENDLGFTKKKVRIASVHAYRCTFLNGTMVSTLL